jgi:hypothetical protein
VPDTDAELPGTMKTKFAQEGQKTEKVSDVLVPYAPATDKFPAQVKEVTLDKNVAKVTTERQSGMVSPATKALWLAPDFRACNGGEGSAPARQHG